MAARRRLPTTGHYSKDDLPRQVGELEQRVRAAIGRESDERLSIEERVAALEGAVSDLVARVEALEAGP